MLALTFANKEDYEKIQEDDTIDIIGLNLCAWQTINNGIASCRWKSEIALC